MGCFFPTAGRLPWTRILEGLNRSKLILFVKNVFRECLKPPDWPLVAFCSKQISRFWEWVSFGLQGDSLLAVGVDIGFLQISVQADKCPADGRSGSIKIKPLGFTEEVELVLNFICDCPCAASGEPKSPKCDNGNGIFECGACK